MDRSQFKNSLSPHKLSIPTIIEPRTLKVLIRTLKSQPLKFKNSQSSKTKFLKIVCSKLRNRYNRYEVKQNPENPDQALIEDHISKSSPETFFITENSATLAPYLFSLKTLKIDPDQSFTILWFNSFYKFTSSEPQPSYNPNLDQTQGGIICLSFAVKMLDEVEKYTFVFYTAEINEEEGTLDNITRSEVVVRS